MLAQHYLRAGLLTDLWVLSSFQSLALPRPSPFLPSSACVSSRSLPSPSSARHYCRLGPVGVFLFSSILITPPPQCTHPHLFTHKCMQPGKPWCSHWYRKGVSAVCPVFKAGVRKPREGHINHGYQVKNHNNPWWDFVNRSPTMTASWQPFQNTHTFKDTLAICFCNHSVTSERTSEARTGGVVWNRVWE